MLILSIKDDPQTDQQNPSNEEQTDITFNNEPQTQNFITRRAREFAQKYFQELVSNLQD